MSAKSIGSEELGFDVCRMLSAAKTQINELECLGIPNIQERLNKLKSCLGIVTDVCCNKQYTTSNEDCEAAPTRLNLNNLILNAACLARQSCDAQCAIVVNCDPLLVLAQGHRRIFRVIFNIASNAANSVAAGGGTRIRVNVKPGGYNYLIDIECNGYGLSDRTTEWLIPTLLGTDIGPSNCDLTQGLSVANTITRDFGGRLMLLRNSPDGSVFRVRLPRGLVRHGFVQPSTAPRPAVRHADNIAHLPAIKDLVTARLNKPKIPVVAIAQ